MRSSAIRRGPHRPDWRPGRPRSIPTTGPPATRPGPTAWPGGRRSTRPSTGCAGTTGTGSGSRSSGKSSNGTQGVGRCGWLWRSETSTTSGRPSRQLRERERQLESLMGHLPGLAYRALADDHWTALFASKGIEDLTGYPADEFTSRRLNYADIMLPEDRPATREAVLTALRERRMYEAEHRIRHKDGSVRWIWARGHGVFAPDGSLRFIEGLNLDMTRQKQAEEKLRESEQRWRSLTEALPQLVWTATPDGACDYFSTQWTQYTGVPASEILGWRWLEVLHPDDREATRLSWTESVAGRRRL